MHNPQMMAAVITEENYETIAAMLPAGFRNWRMKKVLGRVIVINKLEIHREDADERTTTRAAKPDRLMVTTMRSVPRNQDLLLRLVNTWMPKDDFDAEYRVDAPKGDRKLRSTFRFVVKK